MGNLQQDLEDRQFQEDLGVQELQEVPSDQEHHEDLQAQSNLVFLDFRRLLSVLEDLWDLEGLGVLEEQQKALFRDHQEVP